MHPTEKFNLNHLVEKYRTKMVFNLSYYYNYYRPYNYEKHRLKNLVLTKEPIVAIGSVMRSGGNLLNRLFDNHVNLRTYHFERLFGIFSDFTHSSVNLSLAHFPIIESISDFDNIFKCLAHKNDYIPIENARNGYVKVNYNNPLPFMYNRRFHKKIFKLLCKNELSNQRDIFNNYLSGFFNSFINYQNLYGIEKKYTTTYWPNFVIYKKNIERFFNVYPDGKLISIIRNPLEWAGSAKRRKPLEFNYQYMDSLWLSSFKNSCEFRTKYPDKFILLDFDQLVIETSEVMNRVCNFLDIKYNNFMTIPTFNGYLIEANSIRKQNQKKGIIKEVTRSYSDCLEPMEIEEIKDRYLHLYEEEKVMFL